MVSLSTSAGGRGLQRDFPLPPGKTYVGLKIVRALLDNKAWGPKSPILVVCYTNHALDQFLEGECQLLPPPPRIIRRAT